MRVKLMRKGREIKIAKHCPNCNSLKFKRLEAPRREIYGFPVIILAQCGKCSYLLAVPENEGVK